MAEIISNIKGFKIIKLSIMEMMSIGGYSICDSCNETMLHGYFIAVLNSVYCERDYEQWMDCTIRYDEDIHYELMKFREMALIFNLI